ncbi:MAG: ribonuclease P protein component, partial [Candidatus Staskawiczbacteria bacterium]|nr:ribonuclease P protein component [Candidatus Staskawiczbacteria bacterium]
MLPKINRIKNKKDFEVIFRKGINFKNSLFILKFLKNDLGKNRFGFVVSQKVSKKAVIRNKVRRRLVEAVKKENEKIKIGTDLVFIALPGIEKKEFSEIKEAL